MMGVNFVITGDSEVARALNRYGDAVSGDMLERAVVTGALNVQNRAKQLAAVLTGTLRRSIHIGGHTFSGGGSDIGRGSVGRHEVEVKVGTNVPYARRIEFGFTGTDSLGRTYNQPPRPYLRPAMEQTRSQVLSDTAAALRDQLRRAA